MAFLKIIQKRFDARANMPQLGAVKKKRHVRISDDHYSRLDTLSVQNQRTVPGEVALAVETHLIVNGLLTKQPKAALAKSKGTK